MESLAKLEKQQRELDSKVAQLNAKTVDGVQIEKGKTYLWVDPLARNWVKQFIVIPEEATFYKHHVEWREKGTGLEINMSYMDVYFDVKAYLERDIKALGYQIENAKATVERATARKERLEKLWENPPTEDFTD